MDQADLQTGEANWNLKDIEKALDGIAEYRSEVESRYNTKNLILDTILVP